MARLPRYVIAGQPQHIIQRGNTARSSLPVTVIINSFVMLWLSQLLETTVKMNAVNYEKQVYMWQGSKLIRKK